MLIVSAALLSLGGCATTIKPKVVDSGRAQVVETKPDYVVQRGETLYSIAARHGVNFRDLAALNGISEPYTIYPGQPLRLSRKPQPVAKATPAGTKKPAQGQGVNKPETSTRYKNDTYHAKPVQEKVANQSKDAVNIGWVWPSHGAIIGRFSDAGTVNKGVDLAGKLGEPVYAAADGTVVYSGPGIVGYGNLIIIKHNDVFLSAYAHNSRLLVQEGDSAKAGQKIAEIGSSGTQRDKLHFEIRKYGRPVDPLQYLPRR